MVKIALAQGSVPPAAPTPACLDFAVPKPEPEPLLAEDTGRTGGTPTPLRVAEPESGAIVLAAARSAAEALDQQGRRLSRQALAEALRASGHAVSNARASALLRILKAEAEGKEPAAVELRRRFQPQPRAATGPADPPQRRAR
jgi:hypothetical protein